MPVEELIEEIVERGHDIPKMIHLCYEDDVDHALCGAKLRGEFRDGEELDCIVCAEIAQDEGWTL